jgi:hypothetical protein
MDLCRLPPASASAVPVLEVDLEHNVPSVDSKNNLKDLIGGARLLIELRKPSTRPTLIQLSREAADWSAKF